MPILETVRFYNPGLHITDRFYFSIEPADRDFNNARHWLMEATEDNFFQVPRDIEILDRVYTIRLKEDVLRRYEERGVCIILEGDKDEAELVKAAKARWIEYCEAIAHKHIDQCQQCRANNMPPLPATGFTRRALTIAGLYDPADAYMQALKGVGSAKEIEVAKALRDAAIAEAAGLRNQLAQIESASKNKKDPRNRAEDTNMGGGKESDALNVPEEVAGQSGTGRRRR